MAGFGKRVCVSQPRVLPLHTPVKCLLSPNGGTIPGRCREMANVSVRKRTQQIFLTAKWLITLKNFIRSQQNFHFLVFASINNPVTF